MNASLVRLSQPAERLRAPLLAALAIGLFLVAWSLLHRGFYTRDQISDTPVYHRYGVAMAEGKIPYRDFRPEYPPGALPVFLAPALGRPEVTEPEFRRSFEWLMLASGAAALAFMAAALGALGGGLRRHAAALAFAALAPLALGSVVLSRYDLWPAALTAAALAALVAGRERLGFVALALGAATKLYPGVLLPLALAHVWRRLGRQEAAVCAAVFFAVLAAWYVPFLVVAPEGLWASVIRQAGRPLQIESLGSAFLLAGHHLWDVDIAMRSSHGSQNLVGDGTAALVVAHTVLQVSALVAIWLSFARGPAGRERLVRASALAVCAVVALGKVLSPQFLIWLVPLVPLVRGRRGLAASALLALALVLTQLWFPYRYWDLALRFDETASWLVLVRDLVLLALLAALAWPDRRESGARTG